MNNLVNLDKWFITGKADGKYIYGDLYYNGKSYGTYSGKILRIDFVERTVETEKHILQLGDEHK